MLMQSDLGIIAGGINRGLVGAQNHSPAFLMLHMLSLSLYCKFTAILNEQWLFKGLVELFFLNKNRLQC